MDLSRFDRSRFNRDRPWVKEASWLAVSAVLFGTWLPGSWWRRFVLRLFGARVGRGVVVKPHVQIKFPWKLEIGDHSWIGEHTWIDNLDQVTIGANACISQAVYLCTGNHDWSRPDFALILGPIVIEDEAWVGARSTVAPAVRIGRGAVLALGSVAVGDLDPWTVYAGDPVKPVRRREERITADASDPTTRATPPAGRSVG